MASKELVTAVRNAIIAGESGGNPDAYNADYGASGLAQILPENWGPWCREAGLPENSAQTTENQLKVIDNKINEYLDDPDIGLRYVAHAWYGGPNNYKNWSDEALNRKQPDAKGNPVYPSFNEYANNFYARLSKATGEDYSYYVNNGANFTQYFNSDVIRESTSTLVAEEKGVSRRQASASDKFYDAFYDNPVVGFMRQRGQQNGLEEKSFTLYAEDEKYALERLHYDDTAMSYAKRYAISKEHFDRLVEMKAQDIERRKRVEASDYGWTSLATVAGMATNIFFDPLTYIPVASWFVKAGTVGKLAYRAAVGGASGYLTALGSDKLAGYRQNYGMMATLGAVGSAGVPVAYDMLSKHTGKTFTFAKQYLMDCEALAENSSRFVDNVHGMNKPFTSQALSSKEVEHRARRANLDSFVEKVDQADNLKRWNVSVLAKQDALRLAHEAGVEIKATAKGFIDERSGKTILIKDNLKDGEDLRQVLTKVRAGQRLDKVVDTRFYNTKVLAAARVAIEHPDMDVLKHIKSVTDVYGNIVDNGEDILLGLLAKEDRGIENNHMLKSIYEETNRYLKGQGELPLSTEDFANILENQGKKARDRHNGYTVLEDGSAVYNEFKYSEKNLANPQKLDELAELDPTSFYGRAVALGSKGIKHLVRSKLYATPSSIFRTSISPTLKGLADNVLFDNPYMDKLAKRTSAESYKNFVKGLQQEYINEYIKLRYNYLNEQGFLKGAYSAKAIRDFDRTVIECFNATKAGNSSGHLGRQWDKSVLEAVELLDGMRKKQLEIGRNWNRITSGKGKQLIQSDWEALDNEYFRVLDDGKHAAFVAKYGEKKAIQLLTEYAITNAKRDVFEKQFQLRQLKEASKQATGKESVAGKLAVSGPATRAEIEELLEKEIASEAKKWATGIVKRDIPLEVSCKELADNALPNFKHRMPIDTSALMDDGLGGKFSFDNELRSFDIDRIMPMQSDRFAGELALSTLGEDINELRGKIKTELEAEMLVGKYTRGKVEQDLDAFDRAIDKLRGINTKQDNTVAGGVARLLNSLSFAQNGGNLMINQLGEIGGTLGYAGADALFDLMPRLGNYMRELRLGKVGAEALEEARMEVFGGYAYDHIFGKTTALESNMFTNVIDNKVARFGDTVLGGVEAMSNVVGLPLTKTTTVMVKSAQKHALEDLARWVQGKDFTGIRNPFSRKKLEAAGIEDIGKFRESLKDYFVYDNGQLIDLDVARMKAENIELFAQVRSYADNYAKRCITPQNGIGDMNLAKEESAFWKVFFMFKDFTLRAAHNQTARSMFNHEIDDCMAMLYSMVSNGVVLGTLNTLRAKAMYPKDEKAQEKYLSERNSSKSLIYGGLMRSTPMSAFSSMNDIAETLGLSPAPTIRTTVNRTDKAENIFTDPVSVATNAVIQLPAVSTGANVLRSGYDLSKDLLTDSQFTQEEARRLWKNMPGQNFIPFMYFKEILLADSLKKLPRKEKQ